MDTDLKAVRDVQRGHIDDTIVPGTVTLVDENHNLRAKHDKDNRDIILVPTPSDDPEDPVCFDPQHSLYESRMLTRFLTQAKLDSSPQTPLSSLHVHLRLVLRHDLHSRNLRSRPALRSNAHQHRHPKRRNRVPLPHGWLGSPLLATFRSPVR